jgi:hypothetical protein
LSFTAPPLNSIINSINEINEINLTRLIALNAITKIAFIEVIRIMFGTQPLYLPILAIVAGAVTTIRFKAAKRAAVFSKSPKQLNLLFWRQRVQPFFIGHYLPPDVPIKAKAE